VYVLNLAPPALDFGDAPDTGAGTGAGNYQTTQADGGPSHKVVAGLLLGDTVDGDSGTLQNAAANADDVDGALPDDEDGVTLTFSSVPFGFTGETYARFRLSSDAAFVADPSSIGAASDGEVEDYVFTITLPSTGTVQSEAKISDTAGGFGGVLDDVDFFGSSLASLGDLDGDGVADLAVGAIGDDDGGTSRGAVWVLLLNACRGTRSALLRPARRRWETASRACTSKMLRKTLSAVRPPARGTCSPATRLTAC
jgi:hypothetical protein